MRLLLLVVFPCLLCLSVCQGHRFLGLFPFFAKSHFIMFEHLMKGLAKKGHQVDIVSPFPLKKPPPYYTDIVKLEAKMQLVNNMSFTLMRNLIGANPVFAIATMAGNDVCAYLEHPEIQKLVRDPPKDPPYDMVFIEVFGAHCFAIIGHLLNIPVIGVSSTSLYPWLHPMIAHPENAAYVPSHCVSFTGRMNFWQRLYNAVQIQYCKMYFNYLTTKQDEIIREHFGEGMPTVRELEAKVAMILVNSHISLNGIQSTTPALIDVGGLHVLEEGPPLQPELEKWLNDSKEGFFYFTFGSMVMIETFPRQFLDIFYKSLGKIAPIRVLMKIPNPDKLPPGLPSNIRTAPWISQLKVLRHPNIKAFITHGGLMGTQEAVACSVPMIGLPLYADQFANIDSYVARNIALKLDINTMTEEDFDAALNKMISDPSYRQNARKLSQKFLDRPMSSIDTANYWIEYIIKYGSDALRSPAMDMPWWQLSLVDVIGFLLLCAVAVITAVVFLVRFSLKVINHHNSLGPKKTN